MSRLRKKIHREAEVSTDSLNDIMFFLLLFFLILSTMVSPNAIKVNLPNSKANRPIDNSKKQIVQAKVLMKNGEYYVYTVKKFTPNLNIPDSYFVFDTKGLKSDQITDERE